MTSNACKLLSLVLSFAFVTQSMGFDGGVCRQTDLSLTQTKTGQMVENKPMWAVKIYNPCLCKFHDIKLLCRGLKSVTPVYPGVNLYGDLCVLRKGDYLLPHESLIFTYTWDTSYDFKLVDAGIVCT